MKKIIINDREYMVPDEVHDLLCFYSIAIQVTVICRKAQKEYYRKQNQDTLKRAKALEKKLDEMLDGKKDESEKELFR
jgi:hypothetical protein